MNEQNNKIKVKKVICLKADQTDSNKKISFNFNFILKQKKRRKNLQISNA